MCRRVSGSPRHACGSRSVGGAGPGTAALTATLPGSELLGKRQIQKRSVEPARGRRVLESSARCAPDDRVSVSPLLRSSSGTGWRTPGVRQEPRRVVSAPAQRIRKQASVGRARTGLAASKTCCGHLTEVSKPTRESVQRLLVTSWIGAETSSVRFWPIAGRTECSS